MNDESPPEVTPTPPSGMSWVRVLHDPATGTMNIQTSFPKSHPKHQEIVHEMLLAAIKGLYEVAIASGKQNSRRVIPAHMGMVPPKGRG